MGNSVCKNVQVVHPNTDDDDDEEVLDKEVRDRIDDAYQTLQKSECNSLLKKYLDEDTYEQLKDKSTLHGGTLIDVIQSGVANLDSEVGVYAPDVETYTVFAPLLENIIEEYHGGFKPIDRHPPVNYGDPGELENLDPDGRFILSVRIRVARSIQGYPLNALLTKDQYSGIEGRMFTTLGRLSGDVAGDYYPLAMMPNDVEHKLMDDGMLLRMGDRFLEGANACREWSAGRGVFFNKDRTFVVWVNGADHVRVIVKKDNGDLASAYRLLLEGLSQLEKLESFSRSSKYGFVTFNPCDLGNALRVSIRARLPRMAVNLSKLVEAGAKLNLVVRGTEGEQHLVQGGVVDIFNRRTLGISEINATKEVMEGYKALLKLEKFSE